MKSQWLEGQWLEILTHNYDKSSVMKWWEGLEYYSLVTLLSYPLLLTLHSIHPQSPARYWQLLGGMSTSLSANLLPFNISSTTKVIILYLNASAIFSSTSKHTLSLRKITTSSQLTFPKISQMKKRTPVRATLALSSNDATRHGNICPTPGLWHNKRTDCESTRLSAISAWTNGWTAKDNTHLNPQRG